MTDDESYAHGWSKAMTEMGLPTTSTEVSIEKTKQFIAQKYPFYADQYNRDIELANTNKDTMYSLEEGKAINAY
jgi:hypothetical protein